MIFLQVQIVIFEFVYLNRHRVLLVTCLINEISFLLKTKNNRGVFGFSTLSF